MSIDTWERNEELTRQVAVLTAKVAELEKVVKDTVWLNPCPMWQCGGSLKPVEEDDYQIPVLVCDNCSARFVNEDKLKAENKNKQKLIDGYYEKWQAEKAEKEKLSKKEFSMDEMMLANTLAEEIMVERENAARDKAVAAIREGVEKLKKRADVFCNWKAVEAYNKVLALPGLEGGKK